MKKSQSERRLLYARLPRSGAAQAGESFEERQALQMCWDIAAKRLRRHDGLEYDYAHAGVSDEHQIEPHYMNRPVQHHNDPFGLWVANAKGACSTCTAHLGALCEKVQANQPRGADIDRILDHFQEPQDFLRLVDADGRQLPPEHKWRANSLVSAFVGAWLQAHYLLLLPSNVDGMWDKPAITNGAVQP